MMLYLGYFFTEHVQDRMLAAGIRAFLRVSGLERIHELRDSGHGSHKE